MKVLVVDADLIRSDYAVGEIKRLRPEWVVESAGWARRLSDERRLTQQKTEEADLILYMDGRDLSALYAVIGTESRTKLCSLAGYLDYQRIPEARAIGVRDVNNLISRACSAFVRRMEL